MNSKTDYDKIRHLQIELDKARAENDFLRKELELCRETTTKQYPN